MYPAQRRLPFLTKASAARHLRDTSRPRNAPSEAVPIRLPTYPTLRSDPAIASANAMTANPSPYQPISCEFHDLLEALATTQEVAQISFRDGDGTAQRRGA